MTEEFRATATFNPIAQQNQISYTTSSLLGVEAQNCSIRWQRHNCSFVDILHHLQGSPTYQCSILDADCTVQAIVSFNRPTDNEHVDSKPLIKVFSFGPIFEQTVQITQNEECTFFVEIEGPNRKFHNCQVIFQQNNLKILPRSDLGALTEVLIGIEDLSCCYLEQHKYESNKKSIVFPTIYQRIVCLKIFNQIVSKGTYSSNDDYLSIQLCMNPILKKSSQSEFRRFLRSINNVKKYGARRFSESSLRMSRKPKNSLISTNIQKSTSDYRQQSQDSFRFSKKKYQSLTLKQSEKESEMRRKTNAFSEQNNHFTLQDSVNYFTQFQNLIFESQEEQKVQVLLLSDSFEQLENNDPQTKQIQKLQIIKAQRMSRRPNYHGQVQDLKIRLIELRREKKVLMKTNKKIKDDISKLEEGKGKDFSQALMQAKKDLEDLKIQHRMLCTKRKKPLKINRIKSQKMLFSGTAII